MFHIYICSTPYHVMLAHLTAELLSRNIGEPTTRILIITESAISEAIELLIDYSIWEDVKTLPYNDKLRYLETKKRIDEWISENQLADLKGPVDIFINDDKRWRNQLLITGIKPSAISLIEDGMGAYIRPSYPIRDYFYRAFFLKAIFRKRIINTGTISSINAKRFFAFRESAFSWFGKNRKLHIINLSKSSYEKKLKENPGIKYQQERLESADIIIMTSPIAEDNFLSIKHECTVWERIASRKTKLKKIVIKPHPRENRIYFERRLKALSKYFSEGILTVVDSTLPAEILLLGNKRGFTVFSPNSTTLANLKLIRPDLNVYHGIDLFFQKNINNSSMAKVKAYFNTIGVPPLKL